MPMGRTPGFIFRGVAARGSRKLRTNIDPPPPQHTHTNTRDTTVTLDARMRADDYYSSLAIILWF